MNRKTTCWLRAFTLLALTAPAPALAQSQFTDPAQIDLAVSQFTGLPIGVEGGARQKVDRRLKLARCMAPLALSWHGSARANVVVQCPDAGSWRIFVPVRTVQQPAEAKAVPVISRGDNVSIAISGKGFTVSQVGEALEAGAVGDWISVRIAGSRETLRARVERTGVVAIPLS